MYVFRLVNGGSPSDILYGMIKLNKVTPGSAIEFEYRIGNIYDHCSVIQ